MTWKKLDEDEDDEDEDEDAGGGGGGGKNFQVFRLARCSDTSGGAA